MFMVGLSFGQNLTFGMNRPRMYRPLMIATVDYLIVYAMLFFPNLTLCNAIKCQFIEAIMKVS